MQSTESTQKSASAHGSSPEQTSYARPQIQGDRWTLNAPKLDQSFHPAQVKRGLRRALENFTDLQWIDHVYQPQGYSCGIFVSGLTIALHTWPEFGLATLDITTTDQADACKTATTIAHALGWKISS
jgi:hypothetical protein